MPLGKRCSHLRWRRSHEEDIERRKETPTTENYEQAVTSGKRWPKVTKEKTLDNPEELTECRKYQRFLAKDSIFAVCRADSLRIGKVVDISRGGAAFQYVSFAEEHENLTKGAVDLEVFKPGSSWCLKKASCCIVYDFEVPLGNSFLDNYQVRRCGIQFGELSQNQCSQLDSFIKDFRAEPI
jgi:hypothetical protein